MYDQQLQTSTAADGMPRWMNQVWPAVFVGCVYVLVAKLSLGLLTPDGVAVFWPAAGIAAGTLIALGPSARWPVAVGAMAATIGANLMGDRNLPSAFVFGVCNAGEAVLAAGLIQRYFGSPFELDRLSHVLALVGAAIVAAAVSGIGGAFGFAAFHGATSFLATWQNWFASDALGIITVAPLLIGLAAVLRNPPGGKETSEGLLALALLVVMSVIAVALPRQSWAIVVPIALLFPVLLWIAARCQPVFAAGAALIVGVAIVSTTTVGYFGTPGVPMEDRVLAARAAILAVALCAYVLAALFAERRAQQAALADSEARLQEALTAGAVSAFSLDVASGTAQRSANAAQILGFDPQGGLSSSEFLARVHPDDRERVAALARGVTPERPGYTVAFRFKQPDGREVWFEETAKGEFDAIGRLVSLKGLTLDVTARKASEDQRNELVAALDRGLGSLLTRVAAVARDTRRGSAASDDYVDALDRRIRSMADVCVLLGRNRWEGVDLDELVRRQLAPHGTDANTTVAGPAVMLPVPATQVLAAVLHELVANAVKHGALSTPHGRVEVSWSREPAEHARHLSIDWREVRGPPVPEAPTCCYGVGVIRELIPRELGGAVALDFAPDGVRCRIDLPLATVA
jgi:PAS domain S-box-containing protein